MRPGGQGKQAKNLHRINYDSRHKLSPTEATTLKTKEKTEANFLDLKARTALETQLRNPICPYDSPDMASPHNTHTHRRNSRGIRDPLLDIQMLSRTVTWEAPHLGSDPVKYPTLSIIGSYYYSRGTRLQRVRVAERLVHTPHYK